MLVILCLNIAQYNLWQYIRHDFFYICEGVQYLLLACLILITEKEHKKDQNGYSHRQTDKLFVLFVHLFVLFAVNDLLDILLFDPHHFGWNEVVFCMIGVIYSYIKIFKNGNKQ